MSPGKSLVVGGNNYLFNGVSQVRGPNYIAQQGNIEVTKPNGDLITVLTPEKRSYLSGGNQMTEAAINTTWLRDIYVSLGEPLEGQDWAVRVYYKPFVVWIWFGALFMALGGILAISDKRYRAIKVKREAQVKARVDAQEGLAT
jgi:cytochrome c-type biogenesis protein CcmF